MADTHGKLPPCPALVLGLLALFFFGAISSRSPSESADSELSSLSLSSDEESIVSAESAGISGAATFLLLTLEGPALEVLIAFRAVDLFAKRYEDSKMCSIDNFCSCSCQLICRCGFSKYQNLIPLFELKRVAKSTGRSG